MMRADCPFDLSLNCPTFSQMKRSKTDSDFYLTAKSIEPAAVLSKRPLRTHLSVWISIWTSYIEDHLLYTIRLLYGFSQRVFVVLKGCWATLGAMYLWLFYLKIFPIIEILSKTHQHGTNLPSKIPQNITLKPHPAEVLLKHDPPFTALGIFRFDFPNQNKTLGANRRCRTRWLGKNRPMGQDWKGLMLRWREQFKMTQIATCRDSKFKAIVLAETSVTFRRFLNYLNFKQAHTDGLVCVPNKMWILKETMFPFKSIYDIQPPTRRPFEFLNPGLQPWAKAIMTYHDHRCLLVVMSIELANDHTVVIVSRLFSMNSNLNLFV